MRLLCRYLVWLLQIFKKFLGNAELLHLLLTSQLGEKADTLEEQNNIRLREMSFNLGAKENILH